MTRTPAEKVLNKVGRPDAYREVLISSGGSTIALSVWDGRPDRAAVVFLPGTMTHPLFYEEFLDALSLTGLTVVGVHYQGHGKSPRTRQQLTLERLVTNARDAVTWTRRAFPEAPTAVLGSSQGGIVAMALAAAGDDLDLLVAHNVLDPRLASSIEVTRFPKWLRRVYPTAVLALLGAGRVLPRVPVPFDAYLDIERVSRNKENAEYFYADPLGLRSYSLGFMATLLNADLTGMRDGSITCPVLVVAGRGDPLFPLSYTREVYESIVAPHKELLILESTVHLLFNEDLDVALPPLLDRLALLESGPSDTAGKGIASH